MKISAIVAHSNNFVIGKNNMLPWHLPADLQHFKKITLGKSILMGRKTFHSIGHALRERQNIVITRDKNFQAPGCLVVHTIEAALNTVKDQDELFIIGGSELYQQMMPTIQRLYLTIIHHTFAGDAFFPKIEPSEWREIERIDHHADLNNTYDYSFVILDRKEPD